MASVNIRKAKKTDAKKIRELMHQQAGEQNTALPPDLSCEAVAENGWGSAAVFVAFVAESVGAKGGELEGYILAHSAYSTWHGRAMFIKEIYVVPSVRHSGVAVRLCRELLQATLSLGCKRCDVRVDKANKAAVGLFEKLGAQNLTEAEDWHLFLMDSKVITEMKTKCEGQGSPQVRPAGPDDMANVMALIQELADYEKMPDGPKINAHKLVTDSSPLDAFFECFVAESDGALVGYTILYHTFSCQGRGVYMEDLYVKPTHRGQGLGTTLMAQVAQCGLTQGASHLEFCVLSWNTPSIAFYQQKGAIDVTVGGGVQVYRFVDSAMRECVQQEL
ncbi:Diamine acetyltransferase 2 [Chionoecetes opilio]|uniref:Diamine acetyltransferase 2 n=1 Tax=Chionoecetes opilio TaxID=41210 RepID=A0A8J4XR60_CHIOP|nr:Diamine acetyltransferase 2 [Chionoecetes opilio]